MPVEILYPDFQVQLRLLVEGAFDELAKLPSGIGLQDSCYDTSARKSLINKISKFQHMLNNESIWTSSSTTPYRIVENTLIEAFKTKIPSLVSINGKFYLYSKILFHVSGSSSREENILLTKELLTKKMGRIQSLDNLSSSNPFRQRMIISREVQREVWRRDEGRCVQCNSNENLEYDHIIPFSKGGSSTVRNLQLLCEKCNRSKSNNI